MSRFPPSGASLSTLPSPTAATSFVCLKMEKKNIKAYFASGLWRRRYTVQVQGRERGMKFADCEPTNQPTKQ